MIAVGSELSAGIENILVDNCHFIGDGKGADDHAVPINNLLFVKTNERRGGFVKNIHMTNVSAASIAGGVLAVETDVLYQWKTLLPTYVRRLTPIKGLYISDIDVKAAKFVCWITADRQMPVRDVRLDRVRVEKTTETPILTENVIGFSNLTTVRS